MDIGAYVGKQILRKLPLFDGLDSYTIGLIALKMKSISCNAGYTLFQANDIAKEIFIQRSGKSLLYYNNQLIYNCANSSNNNINNTNITNKQNPSESNV